MEYKLRTEYLVKCCTCESSHSVLSTKHKCLLRFNADINNGENLAEKIGQVFVEAAVWSGQIKTPATLPAIIGFCLFFSWENIAYRTKVEKYLKHLLHSLGNLILKLITKIAPFSTLKRKQNCEHHEVSNTLEIFCIGSIYAATAFEFLETLNRS